MRRRNTRQDISGQLSILFANDLPLLNDSIIMPSRKIKMTLGPVVLEAELFDTPTAEAIWSALPFDSTASTWGEEVYFSTPVQVQREADARPLSAPASRGITTSL